MSTRRQFISLLGGAAAFPFEAGAQQTMPVIGFLSSLTINDRQRIVTPFHKGLSEAGFIEGRNVAIEYRFAEGQYNRLSALADDLVSRLVTAIAAVSGTPAALAAKRATKTIPIVFAIGGDPVAPGLVSSLNRPEGNVTGVTFLTAPLATKRLGMVRQLAPTAAMIAVLINPNNPPSLLEGNDVPAAAPSFGLKTTVISASTAGQIERVFATMAQEQIAVLYVSADPLFFNQRAQIAALAARHRVVAIYADREIAEAGGLISYGASRATQRGRS